MYHFHRAKPCFGWARLITCIFGVFTGSGTLGAQAPPSNEPILLHEDRDHSELRVEGYEASVECLVNPKGERDYAILGLRATGITDSKTIHLAADDSYFACYSFRDGEILPLFGRLYRAQSIYHSPVVLRPLAPTEIPRGLQAYGMAYVLPLEELCWLHGATLFCSQITARKDTPSTFEAKIEINPEMNRVIRARPELIKSRKFQVVKKDDVLIFDGFGRQAKTFRHRVLQVVPRDDEKHLVGWVEIEQLSRPEK